MSSSEQEGTGLHITKQSRKGARGISSDLIPLAAGARAGTTPIRWVRAPPGRRASRVQLIGVATAETLGEILLVDVARASGRRARNERSAH